MKSKLYKLALWYIGKCNAEWDKRKFTDELKSLDRLTYMMFGKYVLNYGADAEWQKFGRYEVLDNAIQKLAQYENAEQEIRNKVIDEFAEKICTELTVRSFEAVIGDDLDNVINVVSHDKIQEVVMEIADELRCNE